MKQLLLYGGAVRVMEVPDPLPAARNILVRVHHSCISMGTEMAGVRAASEPLYRRALRQPQKIRRAIEMASVHGLRHTLDVARGETQARPLGYSAAGVVIGVGAEVEYFMPGDRVACAGAGIANHAELIDVPVNLAVKVPDALTLDAAATVALGAIALQGVRRCYPQFGETIAVVGLGLLGQLTAQLLKASGCRVVAVDPDVDRVGVARAGGADFAFAAADYPAEVARLTDCGVDAVVVTAASTQREIVNDAVRACRRKGRVVVVGDVALDIDRNELYARELDLLIATSYGPGRYDASYEIEGTDYPLPYVRWTENRNMQAYLDALAHGRVRLNHLPRAEAQIDGAAGFYASLQSADSKPLLALLRYSTTTVQAAVRRVATSSAALRSGALRVALVGSGSFALTTHLPNLARLPAVFAVHAVMSRTGSTARVAAERAGARYATTDLAAILSDPEVDVVLIATRHDQHAHLALAALAAGKHVLLEKPLAIKREELDQIERYFGSTSSAPLLMTGFNRRFSPALTIARELLAERNSPLVINYRVNAGPLPTEHWVYGPEGGGRNLGEACHFYDAFNFLVGTRPAIVQAVAISPRQRGVKPNDNFVATIRYEDGSVCSLTYVALGSSDYPKERMEIFADGKVICLDDYRSLEIHGARAKGWSGTVPDKGHLAELEAFAAGIRTGKWPITLQEQIDATRVSFEVEDALRRAAGKE